MFLFFIVASILSNFLYSESYFVKSIVVSVYSSPSADAGKIKSLRRGTQVNLIQSGSEWSQIKHLDIMGWVKTNFISTQKPQNKVSVLDSDVDVSLSARKRASTFTSTAAARGLVETGRKRIGLMQRPDYEALKVMEKNLIDEKTAFEYLNMEENFD